MPTFTIEMKKTIVVHVDARNADEAMDQAVVQYRDDPDGTWACAEPEMRVLDPETSRAMGLPE